MDYLRLFVFGLFEKIEIIGFGLFVDYLLWIICGLFETEMGISRLGPQGLRVHSLSFLSRTDSNCHSITGCIAQVCCLA